MQVHKMDPVLAEEYINEGAMGEGCFEARRITFLEGEVIVMIYGTGPTENIKKVERLIDPPKCACCGAVQPR